MHIRGEYRGRYLWSKKKKGKICFVIYIAGERFFFIYEVIVKQNKKKGPANHYLHTYIHTYTYTYTYAYLGCKGASRGVRQRRIGSWGVKAEEEIGQSPPQVCSKPWATYEVVECWHAMIREWFKRWFVNDSRDESCQGQASISRRGKRRRKQLFQRRSRKQRKRSQRRACWARPRNAVSVS